MRETRRRARCAHMDDCSIKECEVAHDEELFLKEEVTALRAEVASLTARLVTVEAALAAVAAKQEADAAKKPAFVRCFLSFFPCLDF